MPDRPAVPEGAADEYCGIFNYAVMALMRLWFPDDLPEVDLARADRLARCPPAGTNHGL